MLENSVEEYYFQAILCYLCIVILDAEKDIKRYVEFYPALNDSREYRSLRVRQINIIYCAVIYFDLNFILSFLGFDESY